MHASWADERSETSCPTSIDILTSDRELSRAYDCVVRNSQRTLGNLMSRRRDVVACPEHRLVSGCNISSGSVLIDQLSPVRRRVQGSIFRLFVP